MTSELKNQSPYARVVLVGVDQLIAATSNFMVVWLCLTSLPTEAFGSFSYSWSIIALFVVLSRSLFGIPALLDSESSDPVEVADASSSLTGALVLGILTAIVTLGLYLIGGASENEIWILGLFLLAPLILFQDQIRYLIIATKNIKFAILLDLLVLSCILVTVISAKNSEFVGWNLILGLAFGYIFASLLFGLRTPIRLNLGNLRKFIRLDFHRRSMLVSDALLAWGFGLLSITLIRFGTGDSGIAIYNGLVFIFGPVTLVTVFLSLGLQSELVRTKGHLTNHHKFLLFLLALSPLFWIFFVKGVSESRFESFLGPSTQEILSNSLLFAVACVFLLGIESLNLFLRASGHLTEIVTIRLVTGVVGSVTLCVVASLGLPISFFIAGLTIAFFTGFILTFANLRRIGRLNRKNLHISN